MSNFNFIHSTDNIRNKTSHGFNMSQIWSGIYLPTWPTVIVFGANKMSLWCPEDYSCLSWNIQTFRTKKTLPFLILSNIGEGKLALQLVSRDHLNLAFPWLRGLSKSWKDLMILTPSKQTPILSNHIFWVCVNCKIEILVKISAF